MATEHMLLFKEEKSGSKARGAQKKQNPREKNIYISKRSRYKAGGAGVGRRRQPTAEPPRAGMAATATPRQARQNAQNNAQQHAL